MRVLILENNLFWSSRLRQTVQSLGHEAVICARRPDDVSGFQAALVNLALPKEMLTESVGRLVEAGVHVIAHAGHKEAELLELGRHLGCQQVVSNGSITFKLESMLDQANVLESLG